MSHVAVARTGSLALTTAMRINKQFAHHDHDCTLADAVTSLPHVRHVVVALRLPLARMISGFQRRTGEHAEKGDDAHAMNEKKAANRQFKDLFGDKRGIHVRYMQCTGRSDKATCSRSASST